MARSIRFLGVLALALAIAVPIARADTYRIPPTGSPALSLDAPPGWKATVNPQGGIVAGASDGSALLQLWLILDPKLQTMTEADIAAAMFKSLGAPPPTKSEPGSIGDARGQAFIGATTMGGAGVSLRLVLVRLDATRVALMFETTRDPLTTPQRAALNQLVAHITLVR
jgi:hypothetical protein